MQTNNAIAPRNPGDVLCGGLLAHHNLRFIQNLMITINKKREEYIIIKLTVETNTEANLENEENIINNIMNTIPGISIYKKLVDNTEGNFIFPKQNLNVYVFAELVMNNKL